MNIVFYILVAIGLLFIYFVLSRFFSGIGKFAIKIWKEFKNNIMEE